MEFEKYQHIERFGQPSVDGILDGKVYVFNKIDGTNAQVWIDENKVLHFGSRNRELSLDFDNAGFMAKISNDERIIKFLTDYPNYRVYGEWLKPHTIKNYEDDAWDKFYIFDITTEDEKYVQYPVYSKLLDEYGLDYIPLLTCLGNPTYEDILKLLDNVNFLIKDGSGQGEGIVIKNYDFVNRFGRTVWAKIVSKEFRSKHQRVDANTIKDDTMVETKIVEKYVTKSLVEKEYAKLCVDELFDKKQIPRLLNTIFYSLVTEESWNFIKEFRNPTINFKTLSFLCNEKTKDCLPNLF